MLALEAECDMRQQIREHVHAAAERLIGWSVAQEFTGDATDRLLAGDIMRDEADRRICPSCAAAIEASGAIPGRPAQSASGVINGQYRSA